MSRTVYTYERHNLGDQLIFLHLLRALAKSHVSIPFVHFCNGCHIGQLQEMVSDLPNIMLEPFESTLWPDKEREAICVWKNHDEFWTSHPSRWDWSAFTLAHHAWTAARMGFVSPFTCREHLLFDYPALYSAPNGLAHIRKILVVNSRPCSGQFMAFDSVEYLDDFIMAIAASGNNVMCTSMSESLGIRLMQVDRHISARVACTSGGGNMMSITGIGRLSVGWENIVGIATGPLWPCISTHNNHATEGRHFIALLDNGEQLNLPHWRQMANVGEVMEFAKQEGWI